MSHFMEKARIMDAISMREFFESLGILLQSQRFTIIIDEFDGIPPDSLRGFLHTLRQIHLSNTNPKCPYSVGIVGVRNIIQLNYDRSISPFNIQDEFRLSNFSLIQVDELYSNTQKKLGRALFRRLLKQSTLRQQSNLFWLIDLDRFSRMSLKFQNPRRFRCITSIRRINKFSKNGTRIFLT